MVDHSRFDCDRKKATFLKLIVFASLHFHKNKINETYRQIVSNWDYIILKLTDPLALFQKYKKKIEFCLVPIEIPIQKLIHLMCLDSFFKRLITLTTLNKLANENKYIRHSEPPFISHIMDETQRCSAAFVWNVANMFVFFSVVVLDELK